MRLAAVVAAILAGLLLTAAARAEESEPESLALARRTLDACRGETHAKKMRVKWPAIADETPPDGAEVVVVRGYISYEMSRMVLRGGKVEAGSVTAAQSWFYNQEKGEWFGATAFDVDAGQFARAWNAMRRILAATDERIEPEPKDHPLGETWMGPGSHASADWIRVRARADGPPAHCARRSVTTWDWDGVRRWDGLRDEAVFSLWEDLVPMRGAAGRVAPIAAWSGFAAAEVRAVAKAPDEEQVGRDHEFLDTCLRALGEAGEASTEADVAALDASLAGLGGADYWVRSVREEASRAATRLRIRHHWNRDDVVRTLRTMQGGTWARGDQAKWLRRTFREKDPAGWAAFLIEEVTRKDARPDDVAAAAAELKDLPAAAALPALRPLLSRNDPYVRLEAALALHALDPADEAAKAAVVKLALDRSIACDQRADLTNHWSRSRALAAARAWGGLTPTALRDHVVAAEPDDPVFLRMACADLAKTQDALTDTQVRDAWRRLLDGPPSERLLAAVGFLAGAKDAASKDRMLAALDRLDRWAGTPDLSERDAWIRKQQIAQARQGVEALGGGGGGGDDDGK